MPPTAVQQTAADRFREQVLTNISVALLRRRISGRDLSRRVAGEGSHGWWSKRYNGELALTVTDLGAISDATNIPVAELLGVHADPIDPVAEQINEFLKDDDVPRSVKDDMLGALGHLMRLGYQRASRRVVKSVPRQRSKR
jgi:hypothetical protein